MGRGPRRDQSEKPAANAICAQTRRAVPPGAFRVIGLSGAHGPPSVLIATTQQVVRFVLSDWSVRKGLRAIIAYDVPGIWAALRGIHAVRLVLYTPDDLGAAAIDAAHELARERWFVAQVPAELRMSRGAASIEGGIPLARFPLEHFPLWQAIDRLLEATLRGALGPVADAGPRLVKPGTEPSGVAPGNLF